MANDSMQVTPGYGESVATKKIGGAHHQRVVVHTDIDRVNLVPAATNLAYGPEDSIGSELTVSGRLRAIGAFAQVLGVVVTCPAIIAPAMRVLVYPEPLSIAPVDGSAIAIGKQEVRKLAGVIEVPASAFRTLGTFRVAQVSPSGDFPVLVTTAPGDTSFRMALVSDSEFTLASPDDISVSVLLRME